MIADRARPGLALITGGSRGIGLALARCFAQAGHDLVLVARGQAQLEAAAADITVAHSVRIETLALDLAQPGSVEALWAALDARGLAPAYLVNNAAMGLGGAFAAHEPQAVADLATLNVTSLSLLSHEMLRRHARGTRGGILTMASLGGYVPGPYQAAYYASKAYAIALSEALAIEAASPDFRIAVVVPGPVETGFHAAMGAETALYRRILPAMTADRVAAIAYSQFLCGARVIVPGVVPGLAWLGLGLIPRWLSGRLMAMLLTPR